MSYARPSIRFVPGVHYRPCWAEPEAKPLTADGVTFERLCAAFPSLNKSTVKLLGLLHAARGDTVAYEAFGNSWAQQKERADRLRAVGLPIGRRRGKGFYLSPEGQKALRAALDRVPG